MRATMRPILSGLRERAPELALFAAALAISGFTVFRQIDPFDEGLMLQAARRIAGGQVPYQDFLWVYGPGQPYVLAGGFEAFGASLLQWRLLRVAIDAAVALAVFVIVRREAGTRWALGAWAVTAFTMAQPTGANPFPLPLLLGLAAVALAGTGSPRHRRLLLAAALIALAAAWRLDFGIYGAAAVIATLVLRGEPGRERLRAAAVFGAAAAAFGALLYLPFAIAAGPGDLVDSLVGAGVRGRQGLPFPLSYDGPLRFSSARTLAEDAKDLLGFYVPLASVLGLALAAAAVLVRRHRPPPTLGGLLVLGAGFGAYLLSRSDEFHVQPLAVVVAVALPLVIARAPGTLPRPLAVAGIVVMGFLLAAGAANRVSALLLPPSLETIDVAVADGVSAPPATAAAIERTGEVVQERVPHGEPIYVATTRSDRIRITNPLLYVLAGRDSVYDKDFGPITTAAAQREIVDALTEARPRVVVRWTDPEATKAEPNRSASSSGVRTVDRHLAASYRVRERNGFYEILVPRRGP